MTNQKTGLAQSIFWLSFVVLSCWAAITIYIEISMGIPTTLPALGHRIIGWFVNFLLVRTFLRGMRRYYELRNR